MFFSLPIPESSQLEIAINRSSSIPEDLCQSSTVRLVADDRAEEIFNGQVTPVAIHGDLKRPFE